MAHPKFISIGGKRHLWLDLLQLRREQKQPTANPVQQPTLFDLHEDRRPRADRTAAGPYLEPSLFCFPEREG